MTADRLHHIRAKYNHETTPVGRISVVVEDYVRDYFDKHRRVPDVADYRAALELAVNSEILMAEIHEARQCDREDRATIKERTLTEL